LARGVPGFVLRVSLGGSFLGFLRKFVVSGGLLIDSRRFKQVIVAGNGWDEDE
jgi:hypothetical protein